MPHSMPLKAWSIHVELAGEKIAFGLNRCPGPSACSAAAAATIYGDGRQCRYAVQLPALLRQNRYPPVRLRNLCQAMQNRLLLCVTGPYAPNPQLASNPPPMLYGAPNMPQPSPSQHPTAADMRGGGYMQAPQPGAGTSRFTINPAQAQAISSQPYGGVKQEYEPLHVVDNPDFIRNSGYMQAAPTDQGQSLTAAGIMAPNAMHGGVGQEQVPQMHQQNQQQAAPPQAHAPGLFGNGTIPQQQQNMGPPPQQGFGPPAGQFSMAPAPDNNAGGLRNANFAGLAPPHGPPPVQHAPPPQGAALGTAAVSKGSLC